MEANKISLKTTAISIAAILLIEAGFRVAIVGKTVFPLPALGFVRVLEAVLLIVIALKFEKDCRAIGLARPQWIKGFVKGLVWSAGFAAAAGVFYWVLFMFGMNALDLLRSPKPSSRQQILVYFAVGGILGPFTEEIFFRGIIYGFFRRWGVYTALGVSTLLFVLLHPAGRSLPVTQIVGGIVFALAYEKENNLLVPITIHCCGNTAIYSLTLIA